MRHGLKRCAYVLAVLAGATSLAGAAPVLSPGFVNLELFNAIDGTAVQSLLDAEKYINNQPDETRIISALDTPNGLADSYGARVTGFILPKESGQYRFFIRSDDASQLYLNPTAGGPAPVPGNDVPIAEETGCCDAFHEADGSPETSEPVTLTAGQRYAFVALLKEGGGGDYLQIAWRKEGDTTPAGSLQPLRGPVIGSLIETNGVVVAISQPPQAPPSPGVVEGTTYTLRASATVTPNPALLYYQWQRDGQDIPGANAASYVVPATLPIGSYKYKVRAYTVGDMFAESPEVTVPVVADTFAPVPRIGVVQKGNTFELGIGFNEPVKADGASVQANYSVSPGSIASFRFVEQSGHAVITVAGVNAGQSVTVTVRNVSDLKGNTIPASGATATATLASKYAWVGVGGNEANEQKGSTAFNDDVVAHSDKDFDLISGGTAHWANYDEQTFVYEEITGDFDRQVRVEYQDPTSQWARAGLQFREALDEGVTRAQLWSESDNPTGIKMSQTLSIRVNPTVGAKRPDGTDTPGNNSYEQVQRPRQGFNYDGFNAIYNIQGGFGGAPPYPNAWMRMKREGQKITMWRSADGVNWEGGANVTYSDDPDTEEVELLSDKLYVGIFYAPEFANNDLLAQDIVTKSAVAKFRDYGPAGAPAVDLKNGLVAYWSFDGHLLDSIKDFHGTGRGTTPPAYVDGQAGFGKAIKLDGGNQFVEITGGNENELEFPGGSMSIAGWFRVDAFDTEWQALIAKGEGSNYRIARRANGNSIAYAGGVGEGADDVPNINDGKWHHFVAVSDAAGTEFGTALYVDGVRRGVNATKPVLAQNAARLMIGENPEARNREWEGLIDDIGIWNRVLSAAEVAALYNGGQGMPLSMVPGINTPILVTISRSGNNVVIGWSGAGGTLQSSPTLGAGATWTDVGTANPATIAVGNGNLYYRVRQ